MSPPCHGFHVLIPWWVVIAALAGCVRFSDEEILEEIHAEDEGFFDVPHQKEGDVVHKDRKDLHEDHGLPDHSLLESLGGELNAGGDETSLLFHKAIKASKKKSTKEKASPHVR